VKEDENLPEGVFFPEFLYLFIGLLSEGSYVFLRFYPESVLLPIPLSYLLAEFLCLFFEVLL